MGINNKEAKERRRKKAKEVASARVAAQKHHEVTTARVLAFYDKVDTQQENHLNDVQVGTLLQLLNEDDGEPLLDDITLKSAISFVMRAADKDKSGGIDKDELFTAVSSWNTWAGTHDALGEKVKRELKEIDKDLSGSLDPEELKALLTKLNDGKEVPDSDVQAILKKCDKRGNGHIDMEEVAPALTYWYQMSPSNPSAYAIKEGEGNGNDAHLLNGADQQAEAPCCVVS
jgi:Ca2+-binding EF-hand superfamily protein|tara:strand:- start:10 stop:699 length:690 start_codon:yes stop_codon:yes gene_type:complete